MRTCNQDIYLLKHVKSKNCKRMLACLAINLQESIYFAASDCSIVTRWDKICSIVGVVKTEDISLQNINHSVSNKGEEGSKL